MFNKTTLALFLGSPSFLNLRQKTGHGTLDSTVVSTEFGHSGVKICAAARACFSVHSGIQKKCTKIRGNISRVSPRDEVAKNGRNAGRHYQTGIQSTFMNSREVPLRKLVQVQFVSAIGGWS